MVWKGIKCQNGFDPGRTRTCNPQIRNLIPCPLGHRAAGMNTTKYWIEKCDHLKIAIFWFIALVLSHSAFAWTSDVSKFKYIAHLTKRKYYAHETWNWHCCQNPGCKMHCPATPQGYFTTTPWLGIYFGGVKCHEYEWTNHTIRIIFRLVGLKN